MGGREEEEGKEKGRVWAVGCWLSAGVCDGTRGAATSLFRIVVQMDVGPCCVRLGGRRTMAVWKEKSWACCVLRNFRAPAGGPVAMPISRYIVITKSQTSRLVV